MNEARSVSAPGMYSSTSWNPETSGMALMVYVPAGKGRSEGTQEGVSTFGGAVHGGAEGGGATDGDPLVRTAEGVAWAHAARIRATADAERERRTVGISHRIPAGSAGSGSAGGARG